MGGGRRRLVMEDFYRCQRRRLELLDRMDASRRAAAGTRRARTASRRRDGRRAPAVAPREDAIDEEVRATSTPWLASTRWARTARARGPRPRPRPARRWTDFVAHRRRDFGPWQDAMVPGERWLFHSAPARLAQPRAARSARGGPRRRAAYRAGDAPIASRRGLRPPGDRLARVRVGDYWLRDGGDDALAPDRRSPTALDGRDGRAVPRAAASRRARVRLRAPHRALMVLGDLMLLLGVAPWEAVDWFRAAFVDGAEWVMAPNVAGMATSADGGAMMTKPYAAAALHPPHERLTAGLRYSSGATARTPARSPRCTGTGPRATRALRRQPAHAVPAAQAGAHGRRQLRRSARAAVFAALDR